VRRAATALVWFVALEHLGFLVLEMFLWTTPVGSRVFGLTPSFAEQSSGLAANQGLYNGFLAAGLVWGRLRGARGVPHEAFFLSCVVVAGVFGAITASASILWIQGAPALVALALVVLSRDAARTAGETSTPGEVVRAWVEAFNAGDADAISALYADDATNHQVVRDPVEGRAAIRAMFESEFGAANMECLVENLFEAGEWAILEWRDPAGLRGCGFFHVVEGRIRFQRGYWDRLSFLRQQGRPVPD